MIFTLVYSLRYQKEKENNLIKNGSIIQTGVYIKNTNILWIYKKHYFQQKAETRKEAVQQKEDYHRISVKLLEYGAQMPLLPLSYFWIRNITSQSTVSSLSPFFFFN